MRRDREQGMSMVEIMIVLAILIVVVAGVYSIIFRSTRQYTDDQKIGTLAENGRKVLDEIANELRQANKNAVVIGTVNGAQSIQFNKITGVASGAPVFDPNATTYRLELSPVDANNNGNRTDDYKLVRVYNGKIVTQCDYVKSGGITFTRSVDTVAIKVTLQVADDRNDLQERSVQTSVTLRN